jgi:hypothetical protein
MKSSNYGVRETIVTFKSIGDVIKNANTLVLKYGKGDGKCWRAIPQPVMMILENPLMRFSCMPEMRKFVVKSVVESIYALSGMNGGDFIWEFRGWSDSWPEARLDLESIGQPLRLCI